MKNRYSFSIGVISTALLFLAALTLTYQSGKTATVKDNVFIVIERQTGNARLSQHNVITDIGENHTGEFHNVNTTSAYGVLWISVGNATAGTGLTQLTSEYARWEGTVQNWTNSGDFAYNLTYTHTFTETTNLNAAGAHWSNTGDGNLYAVADFTGGATTFNSNDNLTVTWVFTFDCND